MLKESIFALTLETSTNLTSNVSNAVIKKDDIIKKQESIKAELARKGDNPLLSAELNALLSACAEPLFDGKTIDAFDDIIQGHVHWKITDTESNPAIHSIRAVGMAYGEGEPIDMASYVILTEKENGYDIAIQMDADGQHNPIYIPKLIEELVSNGTCSKMKISETDVCSLVLDEVQHLSDPYS